MSCCIHLDLRGNPCPINFVKCKLALEDMNSGEILIVNLDSGEPEELVASGLRKDGHKVKVEEKFPNHVILSIICNGA